MPSSALTTTQTLTYIYAVRADEIKEDDQCLCTLLLVSSSGFSPNALTRHETTGIVFVGFLECLEGSLFTVLF